MAVISRRASDRQLVRAVVVAHAAAWSGAGAACAVGAWGWAVIWWALALTTGVVIDQTVVHRFSNKAPR